MYWRTRSGKRKATCCSWNRQVLLLLLLSSRTRQPCILCLGGCREVLFGVTAMYHKENVRFSSPHLPQSSITSMVFSFDPMSTSTRIVDWVSRCDRVTRKEVTHSLILHHSIPYLHSTCSKSMRSSLWDPPCGAHSALQYPYAHHLAP